MSDVFSFRHKHNLVLPMEAVLSALADSPKGVMEVLWHYEKEFSPATIHRYISEGVKKKWIKSKVGPTRRQKVLSLTYEGKTLLNKLRGHYQ